MTDLIYQITSFNEKYDHEGLQRAKDLHEQFLQTFPKERFAHLTLDEYALGRNPTDSLGWWLEYHTTPLGSIKGGSASKHIIYYHKKDQEWKYPQTEASPEAACPIFIDLRYSRETANSPKTFQCFLNNLSLCIM